MKKNYIPFNEMKKYSVSINPSRIKGVKISHGYNILTIKLSNDTNLKISENQFENYDCLKNEICKKIQLSNKGQKQNT